MPSKTSISTQGIVVGKQAYGDTSLIVRWLTPGEGRITTMARGAQRPRSPFHRQVDLYYLCDFVFIPARRGQMHTLKEIKLNCPFLGLRKSWVTLLSIDYFAALIAELTESDAALPEDFELFLKAVEHLDAKPASARLVERFERRLLEIHGLSMTETVDFISVIHHHHLPVPKQRQRLYTELHKNT
jgi:DNA repair protein RecO (recombination protein O)